ncbi:MAG: hypothetical protein RL885_14180 [Planctomycetota bacterium]
MNEPYSPEERGFEKPQSREDYDEALDWLIEARRRRPLVPTEHVVMGQLIQLCDDPDLPLEDARTCLESALRIDPGCAEAMIELGWFHHNVLDEAEVGAHHFRRAEELLCDRVAKCLAGQILSEMERLGTEEEVTKETAKRIEQQAIDRFISTVTTSLADWLERYGGSSNSGGEK